MAKNFTTQRKHETGRTISTKTAYGITSDMLVNDENILNKVDVPENCVLVHDDMGYFVVDKQRVNDGLACPHRYDIEFRRQSNQTIMEKIQ